MVALDLCLPGSAEPDDLRPIATEFAHALKPTDLGVRTAVLYVTDVGFYGDREAKVADTNFQQHAWDGVPSRDSELATWEVVVQ